MAPNPSANMDELPPAASIAKTPNSHTNHNETNDTPATLKTQAPLKPIKQSHSFYKRIRLGTVSKADIESKPVDNTQEPTAASPTFAEEFKSIVFKTVLDKRIRKYQKQSEERKAFKY